MRKLTREKGTSGFFEELFLFAVVSVLFVATLLVAVYYGGVKAQEYEKVQFVNEVYNFALKVRGYQPLIHDTVEGMFDYHKIKSVTYDELAKDLVPGFKFYIAVYDVSDYAMHYNATWGNLKDSNTYGYYKVVITYPVDIWVSDHEIHAAKMEVIGWK